MGPKGAEAWTPMLKGSMGGMRAVAHAQDLWFGSAPDPGALRLARRRGVERVIDLSPVARADLALVGAEVGLEWTSIPFRTAGPPPKATWDQEVDQVLALLQEPQGALMFCEDGSLSAALFAVHRVIAVGLPLEEALAEARDAGLDSEVGGALVRAQVARIGLRWP